MRVFNSCEMGKALRLMQQVLVSAQHPLAPDRVVLRAYAAINACHGVAKEKLVLKIRVYITKEIHQCTQKNNDTRTLATAHNPRSHSLRSTT